MPDPDDPEPSLYKKLLSLFKKRKQDTVKLSTIGKIREELFIIDQNTKAKDCITLLSKKNIYEAPIGNGTIIGMVNLLHCIQNPESPVKDIADEVLLLPETLNSIDGLKRMRQENTDTVFLVDEVGEITGQVNIRDIIDTLDDQNHEKLLRPENLSALDARSSLQDVFSILGKPVPSQTIRTIGGWILSQTGRIPAKGETLLIDNLEISILETSIRRIRKISIKPVC